MTDALAHTRRIPEDNQNGYSGSAQRRREYFQNGDLRLHEEVLLDHEGDETNVIDYARNPLSQALYGLFA